MKTSKYCFCSYQMDTHAYFISTLDLHPSCPENILGKHNYWYIDYRYVYMYNSLGNSSILKYHLRSIRKKGWAAVSLRI